MANLFFASLEIPVMITILYEMFKILHNKMLNAICINSITIHQRKMTHRMVIPTNLK